MTFYDVLCQWNKETEIVIKCRKLLYIVVTFVANCRDIFFPSPSRRPLLVFADLILRGMQRFPGGFPEFRGNSKKKLINREHINRERPKRDDNN